MENNNYITQLFERMYNLSKQGNQGPELLAVLDETRELLNKKIELDNWRNSPDRLKDTFDSEYKGPSDNKPELQEFGTPEAPKNDGFGTM